MENTAFIALSRQTALRRQMSVIANNIANMNTTAFKAETLQFVEHEERSRGGDRLFGDRLAYVNDIATVRDFAAGNLEQTGNPFDVSLRGAGFFAVQTPDGERYTRNGRFQLDDAGQLVTQRGDPVLSDTGEPFFFTPEDGQITISADALISTQAGDLGRLRIVDFDEPQALKLTEAGLYTSESLPRPVAKPSVAQFMLEGSNVEAITEVTRMIEVQRAYDRARKLIDSEDSRIKNMVKTMVDGQA